MAPSGAISSFGTLLKIGDGGGTEVFTTIAEVLDISGPGLSQETEEVTNHSSTAGWDEHIGTILRGGEVSFDVNFIPTENTQDAGAGLINDMENRTRRNFRIVFPDSGATTWNFAALVTAFEPSAPVQGALRASVSLLITGQPTLV